MDMTNKLENMDLDREEIRRQRVFRVFALLSYFLAFFYIKRICLEAGWFQNWMTSRLRILNRCSAMSFPIPPVPFLET